MNHAAINRATLLMQQSRYELAERELRGLLSEAPHDAQAHALLSVCLANQDKLDDAQAAAEQAIVQDPDWAYSHYCRSIVLQRRRRFPEAEQSAREAVRLEPEDSDYYAQVAAALFAQSKWQPALDAANEGLAHDAENAACTQLRAMALTKLNRQGQAVAVADAALARNPDNADAHANKGWALLHQGRPRPAIEHFREALRLEPTSDYARSGMIEALKARNPLYRAMLAYFLAMSRLTPRAQWGIIIGGYVGYRVLSNVARNAPEVQWMITPVLIAYIAFVALAWFAIPMFNLLLRLNRFGRHALSRDQRVGANWFGVCLLGLIAALAAYAATGAEAAVAAAFTAGVLALPLTTAYRCQEGYPRNVLLGLAAGMAVVGLAAIVGAGWQLGFYQTTFNLLVIGAIATPWIANAMAAAVPTR